MTAWTDLVKRLSKENPGENLTKILPMAKKLYKKSAVLTKKVGNKVFRNKRRGTRGRRRMRGGDGEETVGETKVGETKVGETKVEQPAASKQPAAGELSAAGEQPPADEPPAGQPPADEPPAGQPPAANSGGRSKKNKSKKGSKSGRKSRNN
jgi:hypothetical protein